MTRIPAIYEAIHQHIITIPTYEKTRTFRWSAPNSCGDPNCPHSNVPFDISKGMVSRCNGHGFLAMSDDTTNTSIHIYQLTETRIAIQQEPRPSTDELRPRYHKPERAIDLDNPRFCELITEYLLS